MAPLDRIEFDDPALSAGAAGMQAGPDTPIYSSFSQFSLYILTLEKQRRGALRQPRFGEANQLV